MTDASDTPSSSTSNEPGESAESVDLEDEPDVDSDRTDVDTDRTDVDFERASGDTDRANVDFENLTLPQRIFVAAVQNPTRGALIGLLLLFGFGFYVAFWFAFPRVAALLSAAAVVVAGVIAAVLVLLK